MQDQTREKELLSAVIEKTVTEKPTETAESQYERLMRLGMTKAAEKISNALRLQFAYEHYLFVSAERIAKFNAQLRQETIEENRKVWTYKKLVFIPLDKYPEVPPSNVLEALAQAKEHKCFDTFEVAKIEWVEEIKDPILFGRIDGCPDRFFISQWDDDVKLEDILFMD